MSGCSRYVTQIVTYGTQMTVEVTFRGNLNVNNNRYFLILSTQEAYNIPVPPPEGGSLDEFLEPGDTPRLGDKSTYFTNYYSTWHSYIILDSLGYFLAKGPFSATNPITRESVATYSTASSKFTFTIRLERIFGASIPDYIYFDVVSADYPTDAQKFLKDHIAPPAQKISKISGSLLSQTDEEKSDIDPALDITSWTIKIE
jgi:hypothetical protein